MSASTTVTNSILLCFPKARLQGSCPLNKLLILPNSRFLASSSSSKGPITNTILTSPQADANNNSSFPNYPLVDGKEALPTASVRRRPSWWTASWGTANNTSKDKKEIPSAATGSSTSPAANTFTATAANTSLQQQNTIVHVVKGGLPCDSVPQFQLSNYGKEALYTLVLLRHGESEWNLQNKFTGWCDVQLTERGRQEAHDAGRLLRQNGIEIDHAFTSYLQRACFTTNMALNTSRQFWVPVTKTWRLNERHYGALQGYNKDTAWSELGLDQELVMEMRRSYDVSPPLMKDDHPHWHGNDRRYKILSQEQLDHTRGESLKDAAGRIIPFYEKVIIPSLAAGNKCLVVSHANTLRTLIKYIDNISDEDIKGMTIPTGMRCQNN
jgi:2,3-bisphosphoglycerate-dependent phosphoglycerate mutase